MMHCPPRLVFLFLPSFAFSFRALQDECNAPLLVFENDNDFIEVTGSNLNATEDVLACTANYRNIVYYQFLANGARYRISTCHPQTDFATELAVDNDICGNVGCTDIETVPDDSCETSFRSAVEFFSEPDETYTIAVMGNDTGVAGNFGLTLQHFVRPENDACSGIQTLQSTYTMDPIVFASTENATANYLTCQADLQIGVYYHFVGTGARFRVSTCHEATNFNSTLVIGDSLCEDIGCGSPYETVIDETCGVALNRGYSMEFRTEEAVNYTVTVRGTGGLEDRGEFGLILMEYLRPVNDVCTNAIPIELEDGAAYISSSTDNATISSFYCVADVYPTVFYTIVGTGETFYASTCGQASFNSSIWVSEGVCDEQFSACGSTNSMADFGCDPEMGYAATVAWDTVQGESYTIAVTGVVPTDRGAFSLQIQAGGEFTPPLVMSGNTTDGGDSPDGGNSTTGSGTGKLMNGAAVPLFFWLLWVSMG